MLWTPDTMREFVDAWDQGLDSQLPRVEFVDPWGCLRPGPLHLVAMKFRVGFGEDLA